MSGDRLLLDTRHQRVHCGALLGQGGEGAVHLHAGNPRQVIKLFHQAPTPAALQRLQALLGRRSSTLDTICAWPQELLRDPSGRVAGFSMPRIEGCHELHALYAPGDRRQWFEHAGFDFLVQAARNLAAAVGRLHEHDVVVGDLNPRNVLVDPRALVRLIDCDSMQIRDQGVVHRCRVGTPHLTPPELQGVDFASVDRTPAHDAYALAILLFQLLMMGRHPYAGVPKQAFSGDMTIERAIREGRYAYALQAETRFGWTAPPTAPPTAILGAALIGLFERAFLAPPATRPGPADWVQALDRLQTSLRPCAHEPRHRFLISMPRCPWCALEEQGAFFFAASAARAESVFDPEAYRRRVSAVPVPAFNEPLLHDDAHVRPDPRLEDLGALRLQFWVSSGTGALLAAVLLASPLWWLGAPLALASGLWGRRQWRRLQRLHQQRQQEVAHARAELDAALLACSVLHYRARFEAARAEALQAPQQLEALAARFRAERDALAARNQELQLDAFLAQHRLHQAHLQELTTDQALRLAAHGIESAAEVVSSRLDAVLGLAPALRQRLEHWRAALVQRFRYDPALGIPQAELQRLDQRFRRLRDGLHQELKAAPAALKRHGETLLQEQQRAYTLLRHPLERWYRAKASLG